MRAPDPKNNAPSRALPALAVLLALALLAGCASKPKKPAPVARRPHTDSVVNYALSFRGIPYVWGGNTPEQGFDCSGFVRYVYNRHGVHLPRTARQQADYLPVLDERERRPGDLVFFNTTGKPYSHVGIYIGNDRFVHASSAKHGVVVSKLGETFWTRHFLGMRRPGQPERLVGETKIFD